MRAFSAYLASRSSKKTVYSTRAKIRMLVVLVMLYHVATIACTRETID